MVVAVVVVVVVVVVLVVEMLDQLEHAIANQPWPLWSQSSAPLWGTELWFRRGLFNNAGHPKIVPRSRKTLDFSRALGVVLGGSVFHYVVVVVLVVLKMFKGAQGGAPRSPDEQLGSAQGSAQGSTGRRLVVASSSSSSGQ